MHDIKKGIVGIRAKAGSKFKFAGTGFVVHGGLLVTCAQVILLADTCDDVVPFHYLYRVAQDEAVALAKKLEAKA